jgi:hypothetical protein
MKIQKNQTFFKNFENQMNIFEKSKTQLYEKSSFSYFDFPFVYQF